MSRAIHSEKPSRPLRHAQLGLNGIFHTVLVIIDSGADESFLDMSLADKLGIFRELLPEPIDAKVLDGQLPTSRLRINLTYQVITTKHSLLT